MCTSAVFGIGANLIKNAFWEGQRSNRKQFSEAAVFGYPGRARSLLCQVWPIPIQPTICPHPFPENMKALFVTQIWKRMAGKRMLDRDLSYVAEPAPSRMV